MNIVQIRGSFEDNGPGTQTLTISKELIKRGHNIKIISSGGVLFEKMKSLNHNTITIPELSLEKRNLFNVVSSIRKLKKIIENENIDVIHAHNAAVLYISYFAYLFSKTDKKIKFFHSCRGVELRPNYQWRNWIYKIYPAKIFAVSMFTKNILKSFGVNEKKIIVTYNGVDLNRFDISKCAVYRNEIRKEFNIPKGSFVVGLIGRMGVKGHDVLLKAFSVIYHEFPDIYIVLVGSGTKYEEMLELAKKLNIDDRVIFTGLRTDVEKIHASFDLFTLLSTWGEMFPNAILESMAYSTPFISTNISGIPEMAENNEGFIVEPNDFHSVAELIKKLYNNRELLNIMGQNARRSILEKYNIVEVVNKIEDEYIK